MYSSTLRDKTLELVRNRPRLVTFEKISNETGLTVYWLKAFARGPKHDPGVCKVETLYIYLAGQQLNLGNNVSEHTR